VSAADPDTVPVVQMRHPHAAAGDEPDEPRQLESLTKTRPKQTGKRPPSSHFRTSKLPKAEDLSPTAAAPFTPGTNQSTSSSSASTTEPVAVSVGPATTSFPAAAAESRSSPQPSPGDTRTAADVQTVAKELSAVASKFAAGSAQMGAKSSRQTSTPSHHSNKEDASTTGDALSVSRAEFDDFRAEVLKRLAKLEEKVFKLAMTDSEKM